MMAPVLAQAAAQGYAPEHLVCAGETPKPVSGRSAHRCARSAARVQRVPLIAASTNSLMGNRGSRKVRFGHR